MKKYIKIICLSALLSLVACDDYLDIEPKGSLIPQSVEDYERLLVNYDILKTSAEYGVYLTDDVFIPEKFEDNYILGFDKIRENYKKNLYTFDKEVFLESEKDYSWISPYKAIYNYNVIIDNVIDLKGASERAKQSVRAEAMLGRALEYLNLVNTYAKHYDEQTASTDLAVPLILDDGIDKENLKRATVKEVYTQIEKDLLEAVKYLPVKSKSSFRASKASGYGALARMYLYLGDYQKALSNANASLGEQNFLQDLKRYNLVEGQYFIGRVGTPEPIDNKENIYLKYYPYVFGVSYYVCISKEVQDLFDKQNDKRFLLYVSKDPAPYWPNFKNTGLYLWCPFTQDNAGLGTPEVYLIAAECEARVGSKDRAMELINKLRDNRILNNTPLTASSNDDALVKVLEERRRELLMRGLTRLIDLKRLNKDSRFAKTITHKVGDKSYTLEPNSPRYVFPIPHTVLKFNPNMKQNER